MIIAISGQLGSGKSTLSNYLRKHFWDKYEILFKEKGFADKLKQQVAALTGVPLISCYTQDGKNFYLKDCDMTVGQMLQKIGDGLRNIVHQDIWVKALFADYNNETDNWIIPDLRYPNEYAIVKQYKGIVIRLEGDPKGIAAASSRDLTHYSEVALNDDSKYYWDFKLTKEENIDLRNLHLFGDKIVKWATATS